MDFPVKVFAVCNKCLHYVDLRTLYKIVWDITGNRKNVGDPMKNKEQEQNER